MVAALYFMYALVPLTLISALISWLFPIVQLATTVWTDIQLIQMVCSWIYLALCVCLLLLLPRVYRFARCAIPLLKFAWFMAAITPPRAAHVVRNMIRIYEYRESFLRLPDVLQEVGFPPDLALIIARFVPEPEPENFGVLRSFPFG
eukprot:TRINITY_DN16732_c0_g1_i4.p1 TRINITY_DN16732_c0_g1~~TRINITY_DN16732_c0_g1_i4.p1  ORF type:complete len:147 (-),score=11.65 TRINITY_DN16732_c0_g1_i4:118-558(-)